MSTRKRYHLTFLQEIAITHDVTVVASDAFEALLLAQDKIRSPSPSPHPDWRQQSQEQGLWLNSVTELSDEDR